MFKKDLPNFEIAKQLFPKMFQKYSNECCKVVKAIKRNGVFILNQDIDLNYYFIAELKLKYSAPIFRIFDLPAEDLESSNQYLIENHLIDPDFLQSKIAEYENNNTNA